jgi:hypothetical protein
MHPSQKTHLHKINIPGSEQVFGVGDVFLSIMNVFKFADFGGDI